MNFIYLNRTMKSLGSRKSHKIMSFLVTGTRISVFLNKMFKNYN